VKKYFIKGCPLYKIQVLNFVKDEKPSLENHPILREYKYVFPVEVPGLPPRRDIDFSIELVPGAVPMSRTPYRMSMPELFELKLQPKEMWDQHGTLYQLQCNLHNHVLILCAFYKALFVSLPKSISSTFSATVPSKTKTLHLQLLFLKLRMTALFSF
jgi:hypothetical protein